MNRWVGRTAVVTGASDGIGIAICRSLVRMGMTVLGCDRNVSRIRELIMELHKYPRKLHVWRCDMSIESDILAMYDYIRTTLGSVAVSVNNEICCINSSLLYGNSNDWRYMMKAGVEGTSVSVREAVRLMKENFVDDGQIIQVGSLICPKSPLLESNMTDRLTKSYNLYNGTKIMNRTLAEGLRQELRAKHSGIRLTTVSIRSVEDELFTRSLNGDIARMFFASYKYLHPKDVVEAVMYILQTPPGVNVNDVIIEPLE